MKFMRRQDVLAYGLVLLTATGTASALYWNHRSEMRLARFAYAAHNERQAAVIVERFEHLFRDMYQGLRTTARLPSVRNALASEPGSIEDDALEALQEIYRNLRANIALSEVYLVPGHFDPDKTDGGTGQPQEPLLEYDEYIRGQNAGGAHGNAGQLPEEIEIHEWRAMHEQVQWFKRNYPQTRMSSHDSYPAIGSSEVITCDNSRYSTRTRNDLDRSGLVFSVPVYDTFGVFRGLVSAVILSHALRDLLPEGGDFALRNMAHRYTILPVGDSQPSRSIEFVESGRTDPGLVFSKVSPFSSFDAVADWTLWSGAPNAGFHTSAEVEASKQLFLLGLTGTGLVASALSLVVGFRQRRLAWLERRVRLRTGELRHANLAMQRSRDNERRFIGDAAHELRTPMAAIRAQSQIAQRAGEPHTTTNALARVMKEVDRASRLVDNLLLLAQVDHKQLMGDASPVDLIELVEQQLAGIARTARSTGVSIALRVSAEAKVVGIRNLLETMASNVISNSVRHARSKVSIHIDAEQDDGKIWIRVDDDGPGIPAELTARVFDRFYRVAGVETPGSGLGLSIVKRVCELHSGEVALGSSEALGGTQVVISLPARQ